MVTVLLFVSMSIVGCGGVNKTSKQTVVKKSNINTKKKTLFYDKKAENIYVFSTEHLKNIFADKKKKKWAKELLNILEDTKTITKENSSYRVNTLDEVIKDQTFDNIAHDSDDLIVLTKQSNGKSFIFYYSKEKLLTKLVVLYKKPGKLTLSNDAKMVFVKNKRTVIDLDSFKTVQTFTGKDIVYNDNYHYISNIRFSNNNKYLMFNLNHIFNFDTGKHLYDKFAVAKIKDKKKMSTFKTDGFKSQGTYKINAQVSNNNKYVVIDSWDNNNSNIENRRKNAFYLFPLTGQTPVKTFFSDKYGSSKIKIHTAWNKDLLFYQYTRNDETKSGIYDISNDKTHCENLTSFSNIKKVIWTKTDNIIYVINNKNVYPIVFKNNECFKMKSYSHKIKELEDSKYTNKFIKNNDNLTVYSQNDYNTKINSIELKEYTQNDIDIVKSVNKAAKLIDSGFESRGLKLIDKLAVENYEWNAVTILKTKKYTYAYDAYLASKHFNKRIKKSDEVSEDLLYAYRPFVGFASWYGYENLIPEIQKIFKQAVKTKKLYDKKIIEEHIAVSDATYLLSIDKDEEAYNLLFEHQPFTDLTKKYIADLTTCSSSLTKDTTKLSAATEIPKEKFQALECAKYDPYPFFFDINGNKVFKDEEPKKSKPKKKVEKTKTDEAIELLD